MGFDFPEDDPEDGFSGTRSGEDARNEKGRREQDGGEGVEEDEEQEEDGALPEPDAAGRKMAESEEVREPCMLIPSLCRFLFVVLLLGSRFFRFSFLLRGEKRRHPDTESAVLNRT